MNGDIKIRTLRELAALPDPAAKAEKLFDWYFERQKLMIEVTAVSLGAFFAALIVAALQGAYVNNWTHVAIAVFIVVLLTGYVIRHLYLGLKRMEDEFIAALDLLVKLSAP
jgi:Flp pilus assembly protein TadB